MATMGFSLKKATMLTLRTKDEVLKEAQRLKGFGGTECEREEKEKRKEKIKSKILSGDMRPFTWAVGEVRGGPTRRVDGQHSSEVFLELTEEEWRQVRLPVIVFQEWYDCETLRDLPVLFEQFNPPWSSRNAEDLIGAHFGIHEDLQGRIDRHVATRITHGMSWYARKVEGRGKDSTRQFNMVHENHDTHAFLIWCGSFLQRRKTEEMFHPSVVGAMRHTFCAEDETYCDFWKMVAGGKATNEEGTPAYKLAKFLEDLADPQAEWPRSIAKHFGTKRRPSEAQVFATCLAAFLGHRTGKRLGDIFTDTKSLTVKQVAADFSVLRDKNAA
jgi:hypothetical protein